MDINNLDNIKKINIYNDGYSNDLVGNYLSTDITDLITESPYLTEFNNDENLNGTFSFKNYENPWANLNLHKNSLFIDHTPSLFSLPRINSQQLLSENNPASFPALDFERNLKTLYNKEFTWKPLEKRNYERFFLIFFLCKHFFYKLFLN